MSPPFLAFGAVGNYRPSLWNLHLDDIGHFDGVGRSKKFTRPISADRPLRVVYIHHGKIFSRCRERTIFNGGDSRGVCVSGARCGTRKPPVWIKSRRNGGGISGPYFSFKICLNKYTSLRMADEVQHASLPKLSQVCDRVSQLPCVRQQTNSRRVCRTRGSAAFTKNDPIIGDFFEHGSDRP